MRSVIHLGWGVKCSSCGAPVGKPCYGNGPMPASMTHAVRVRRDLAESIVDEVGDTFGVDTSTMQEDVFNRAVERAEAMLAEQHRQGGTDDG